jgi:hypothetical protein
MTKLKWIQVVSSLDRCDAKRCCYSLWPCCRCDAKRCCYSLWPCCRCDAKRCCYSLWPCCRCDAKRCCYSLWPCWPFSRPIILRNAHFYARFYHSFGKTWPAPSDLAQIRVKYHQFGADWQRFQIKFTWALRYTSESNGSRVKMHVQRKW